MKINSIYDEKFAKFGKIINYPFTKTLEILKQKNAQLIGLCIAQVTKN